MKMNGIDYYLNYKNYFIIFIIITLVGMYSLFLTKNYESPMNEIIILVISLIAGTLSIAYYINTKNIYKTAIIVILLFGLMFVFLSPVGTVPDEKSEMVISEMTSRGVLFPEYVNHNNEIGFQTIGSIANLPTKKTVLTTDWDNKNINYTLVVSNSTGGNNVFYSHVAQAVGIGLAKILNLNNIFLLWFARICNLLLYAGLCGIAIKKTPILKMQMAVIACFPLSIITAASASSYAFVYSFALIVISYLLNMYKSKTHFLTKKNMVIYTILVLILSIVHLIFGLLILLLFIVPKDNFKEINDNYLKFLSVIFIIITVGLWLKLSNSTIITSQLNYILSDSKTIVSLIKFPNQISGQVSSASTIFKLTLPFFNYMYLIFIVLLSVLYPMNDYLSKNRRVFLGLLLLITVLGSFLIKYFFLSNGVINPLDIKVDIKDYLPILVLLPLVFNINNEKIKNIDLIVITSVISFVSVMVIFISTAFY